VQVIYGLRLLLNLLPQTEVGLEHLLHHLDRVRNALRDLFLLLSREQVVVLRQRRPTGNLLQLLPLLLEELIDVLLLVDHALGHQFAAVHELVRGLPALAAFLAAYLLFGHGGGGGTHAGWVLCC